MKGLIFLFAALGLLLSSCSVSDNDEGEWQSIFNGEDLDGWTIKMTGYPPGVNFNNTFRVEDGLLKVSYDNYEKFDGEFGHIFYRENLSSYKLSLKYRFTGEQVPGGPSWGFRNSGIMLHSQSPESMLTGQNFPVSIEAQFLGGDGVTERSTLNVCTPGTNIIMDGELIRRHCTNSNSETYHGDGWVSTELVVYADSIIHHIVEGDTVITYQRPQIDGDDLPEGFPLPDGTLLGSGFICLQAESHPVEFKDIKIMKIK
ncbi:MAG TPA: DUF1080 domain-containing protein [Bacteroidetes bacterium]|nr:DUF1080 domain-containing protein [Bacteroidota bacterium]